MKQKIKAIYWVSVGAIIASYWSAWYSAQEMYDKFFSTKAFFSLSALNLISRKSLLKTSKFTQWFWEDLPKDVSDLSIKTYLWTTNANTGKFVLFDEWDLQTILLWSMAIPWIFPAVPYWNYVLMDWWVTENFPVKLAKKRYPSHEIIGISLNKFREYQKISTLVDALFVSFEILLRNKALEGMKIVDHLFYKQIPLKIIDVNKKNIAKAYAEWYDDCIAYFKK